MKPFSSVRWASAIQIVRTLKSAAEPRRALRKKSHVFVKCRSSNSLENSMKTKSNHPRLGLRSMRKVVFATFSVLLTLAVLSTPALADRKKGTVKWYNAAKGMGFLAPADGAPDVFVHKSAISGSCNGTLREGQAVEFDIALSPDGRGGQRPSAANVTCK